MFVHVNKSDLKHSIYHLISMHRDISYKTVRGTQTMDHNLLRKLSSITRVQQKKGESVLNCCLFTLNTNKSMMVMNYYCEYRKKVGVSLIWQHSQGKKQALMRFRAQQDKQWTHTSRLMSSSNRLRHLIVCCIVRVYGFRWIAQITTLTLELTWH